ncbi:uncharacterized protein [Diabrotica undecimpunctata]|uniref:uncharacterized protein n=1 Tax=Diabrotica undecimpunctata TaxID=50387 RepID=UPI003B640D69
MEELLKNLEKNSKDSAKLFGYLKAQQRKGISVVKIDNRSWETHFTELYRCKENPEQEVGAMEDIRDNEIGIPTYDEYLDIIQKIKQKRTPGPDEIPNELIKNGGEKLLTSNYNLIVKIWEAEEMPEDWKEGRIIPIFKKGEVTNCTY